MQNTLPFPELEKPSKVNEGSFTYTILNKLGTPKPTEVYNTYWKFAAERQEIFFRKQHKRLPPWTNDPILEKYKFTNAYRASDRVSQYLIKNVIYTGDPTPDETFFRIILFKTFNKIETWELLEKNFGPISFATYSYDAYDRILSEAMKKKHSIYSGAYIMASGKSVFGFTRKHQNHLKLIERMMHDKLPSKICELKSMDELYNLLYSYPTIGQFLAYQYATDINYSDLTEFDEMEFVIPGPGARDGIKKCFSDLGDFNESEIIRLMSEKQEEEFDRLGISFPDLWGRSLQLIDCQNLFCEVDKYARVAHPKIEGISKRTRIKQKYKPISKPLNYWYPPKWGINSFIGKDIEA
jgi:hypothetical protein